MTYRLLITVVEKRQIMFALFSSCRRRCASFVKISDVAVWLICSGIVTRSAVLIHYMTVIDYLTIQ